MTPAWCLHGSLRRTPIGSGSRAPPPSLILSLGYHHVLENVASRSTPAPPPTHTAGTSWGKMLTIQELRWAPAPLDLEFPSGTSEPCDIRPVT